MVSNPDLKKIMSVYKQWLDEGLEPTMKNFLFHEDPSISQTVVSLTEIRHEISTKWKEVYDIDVITREQQYLAEVQSVLIFLKLRKIKGMVDENQRELEQVKDASQLTLLIKTHQHLKSLESQLTRELGTVILK
jgi:DNA primase